MKKSVNPLSIRESLASLETLNPLDRRRICGELLEFGADASPEIADALRTGSSETRKAAAYLLGHFKGSDEAMKTLSHALLSDAEPKVRQNAAVSLGKIAAISETPSLVEALNRETASWVRRSILLALGAIGGDAALEALSSVAATEELEKDALRKALDRTSSRASLVEWRSDSIGDLEAFLEAPPGLETVASAEAKEIGGFDAEIAEPGSLRILSEGASWERIAGLHCVYGSRIAVGERISLDADRPIPDDFFDEALLGSFLPHWRDRIRSDADRLFYRFSIDGRKMRRDDFRRILEDFRNAIRSCGWEDSPSHYDAELILREREGEGRLYLKPSFMKDRRFEYRVKDVGASLQPVVAAGLARLVRSSSNGTVFDPTCGSGTTLIERARLDPGMTLRGIDISATAVSAARANLSAAGFSSRMIVEKGDATQPEAWPECDEVIANLPFGFRTRHEEMKIEPFYEALMKNLVAHLKIGGKALLYTAHRKGMEAALARHRSRLRTLEALRVQSGGLWCGAWLLVRKR